MGKNDEPLSIRGPVGAMFLGNSAPDSVTIKTECPGPRACPYAREEKAELARQAEFAHIAKIWCPKLAREFFEYAMTHHGFTMPQLRRAWRAGKIGWDGDEEAMVFRVSKIEPTVISVILAVTLPLCVLLSILAAQELDGVGKFVALTYMAAASFLLLWVSDDSFLKPWRTALRLQRVYKRVQAGN
jgi:hypothetical protein